MLYHMGQPFLSIDTVIDVAVCFRYKMADCIGSEFLHGNCCWITLLEYRLWNKYTCIHS